MLVLIAALCLLAIIILRTRMPSDAVWLALVVLGLIVIELIVLTVT